MFLPEFFLQTFKTALFKSGTGSKRKPRW